MGDAIRDRDDQDLAGGDPTLSRETPATDQATSEDGVPPARTHFSQVVPLALVAAADASVVRLARVGAQPIFGRNRDYIAVAGEPCPAGLKVQQGFCAPIEVFPEGTRALTHIYVPGDIVVLRKLNGHVATSSVVALSTFQATPIAEGLATDNDSQASACANVLTNERTFIFNRIASLTRRTARERLGRLLLELFDRVRAHRPSQGRAVELPLAQQVFADVAGLSLVHVNKSLGWFRDQGAIDLKSQRVLIRDRGALVQALQHYDIR